MHTYPEICGWQKETKSADILRVPEVCVDETPVEWNRWTDRSKVGSRRSDSDENLELIEKEHGSSWIN